MKVYDAKNRFTKTEFQRDEDWDTYPKSEYTCPDCGETLFFTFQDLEKHSHSEHSNLSTSESAEMTKRFNKSQDEFNSFLDFHCPGCEAPTRVFYLFWAGGRYTHGYTLKYVALLTKNAV